VLLDEVADVITAWSPPRIDGEVATFARLVVASVEPQRPTRARALLFAASRLGAFCSSIGLELDPTVCFSPPVIERFIACGCRDASPATRRTLRTNLRHLAARARQEPPPLALPRERAKLPYSQAEISSYLALCDAQRTVLRRGRANALICLGAGAGLVGAELRHVRGRDVVSRSGGMLVEVGGRRPRAVPVLARYHDRLLAAAAFFNTRHLVSGENPNSHNVTNPLISSLSGGIDLERLDTSRLRSTYLAEMAEQIGLSAFMSAAGISCSQRLGDLVSHLE
jgi:integrase